MDNRCPDLVILDVMFPDNSSGGFELARRMRHHREDLTSVPILMLTAVNTVFPLGFGAQDIGDDRLPVSDFLGKPVDLGLLRDKVAALVG